MANFSIIKMNGNLKYCDKNSLLAVIIQAQSLGIELARQEGYVLPFNMGAKTLAQLMIGKNGYIKKANETEDVKYLFVIQTTDEDKTVKDAINRGKNIFDGNGTISETSNFYDKNIVNDNVNGYLAYIEFGDGRSRHYLQTLDQLEAHHMKYSRTYQKNKRFSVCSKRQMDEKCVIKHLLGVVCRGMFHNKLDDVINQDFMVYTPQGKGKYLDNPSTEINTTIEDKKQDGENINNVMEALKKHIGKKHLSKTMFKEYVKKLITEFNAKHEHNQIKSFYNLTGEDARLVIAFLNETAPSDENKDNEGNDG